MKQIVVEIVLDPMSEAQADDASFAIADHLKTLTGTAQHIRCVQQHITHGPYYRPYHTRKKYYERSST